MENNQLEIEGTETPEVNLNESYISALQVFGELPKENITHESLFDVVSNSEFGQAKTAEMQAEITAQTSAKLLQDLSANLGVKGEFDSIESLTKAYTESTISKFAGSEKETKTALNELAEKLANTEKLIAEKDGIIGTFDEQKAEIEATVRKDLREQSLISNAILTTQHVSETVSIAPELYMSNLRQNLADDGLKLDSDGSLLYDGTNGKTKNTPVYLDSKKQTIKDYASKYLSDMKLINISNTQVKGTPLNASNTEAKRTFKLPSRYANM